MRPVLKGRDRQVLEVMMSYMSKSERRAQIIDATIELVVQEGLHATTVRRIAARLDCSPGQIHHHFHSADELRAEAVREVYRRLEPSVEKAMLGLPAREKLHVLLSGCSNIEVRESVDLLALITERFWRDALSDATSEHTRKAIVEGLERWRDSLIRVLQGGVDSGEFPATLEVEAVGMRLLVSGFGLDVLRQVTQHEVPNDKLRSFMDGLMDREGL